MLRQHLVDEGALSTVVDPLPGAELLDLGNRRDHVDDRLRGRCTKQVRHVAREADEVAGLEGLQVMLRACGDPSGHDVDVVQGPAGSGGLTGDL